MKTLVPFTQECFVPSLVEIGTMVLEKIILKISSTYFLLFCYHLSLEKGRDPLFEQQ